MSERDDQLHVLDPAAEDAATEKARAREMRGAVLEAVERGDREALIALLEELHPADVADILEQMDSDDRARLLSLWGREIDGEVLSELEEGVREEVLEYLAPAVVADAVRELETDDLVDLVEDLEKDQQIEILRALSAADRAAVEDALSYPEESAARLMQREFVIAPTHWTVGDTIDFMRAARELPEQFYHVILVDPKMRPIGLVPLGRIMASKRDTPLGDIVDEDIRTIKATQSQEDVAYLFNHYHMITAPVVDEDGRLIGVITIDDAMAVLDEEAEEDLLLLAGVGGEESLSDTVLEIARQRFVWLFVNLLTAILASLVINHFSDTIQAIVALAVLMPIVASMGGNAGTQSMTVAVRAIATRDLTAANAWRVVRRELLVGLANGAAFAAIMGVVTLLWFGQPMIGVVIALAMTLTLMAAGIAGVTLPILLDKLGIDPALASGPFVTTVTDVVGFLAFLGLGSWLLL
ncbi:MAG: magnesium transporter [Alphaproteobacteria bacterium]|nr:MAG: magnesium transporter [Alphaproteobacteria bacterium]